MLFLLFITSNCFNINIIFIELQILHEFCTFFYFGSAGQRRSAPLKVQIPITGDRHGIQRVNQGFRTSLYTKSCYWIRYRKGPRDAGMPPSWSAWRFSRELLALSGFLLLITSRAFIRSTSSYCCGANTISKYIPFSGELCFLPSGWVNPNGNGRRLRATALIPDVTIPHARTIRVTDRLCTYLRWWRFVNSFVNQS